jgi:lipopolysaccharide export system ATP-binding protein
MTSLSVRNLSFSVGSKQIIKSISLSIQQGQIVALLGPNGAGKTTLLKTIMGVHKTPTPNIDSSDATTKNVITFNNILLNCLPIHKRASLGLVYLPQQTSLFAQMSVNDNLWLVYEYHDFWKNQSPENFKSEVMQWLEKTNLSGTINQTAQSLSGGQKRKLEIIRSLLMRPSIVLLDEPFAGGRSKIDL